MHMAKVDELQEFVGEVCRVNPEDLTARTLLLHGASAQLMPSV